MAPTPWGLLNEFIEIPLSFNVSSLGMGWFGGLFVFVVVDICYFSPNTNWRHVQQRIANLNKQLKIQFDFMLDSFFFDELNCQNGNFLYLACVLHVLATENFIFLKTFHIMSNFEAFQYFIFNFCMSVASFLNFVQMPKKTFPNLCFKSGNLFWFVFFVQLVKDFKVRNINQTRCGLFLYNFIAIFTQRTTYSK